MIKSNIFQPIRYQHSTCRPYCFNLPINFSKEIVHLVYFGGDCSHGRRGLIFRTNFNPVGITQLCCADKSYVFSLQIMARNLFKSGAFSKLRMPPKMSATFFLLSNVSKKITLYQKLE